MKYLSGHQNALLNQRRAFCFSAMTYIYTSLFKVVVASLSPFVPSLVNPEPSVLISAMDKNALVLSGE